MAWLVAGLVDVLRDARHIHGREGELVELGLEAADNERERNIQHRSQRL
eukprot:CAMPEP_0119494698 /NCGR_PEP_ID=MMETSP1344-20130328/18566_1 /TAXON_ID=236787 /ORGANISM="Florenciella parvula, Strain CCMP2471" /LENGTH=48 /DNA_ID= /DNA_START= /DNA_END= /DNA_ORIENTATION=